VDFRIESAALNGVRARRHRNPASDDRSGYFERLGSQFGVMSVVHQRGIDANGVHSEPTQLSCENLAIGAVIIDHRTR
jgi:hypothetical protein